MNKVVFSNGAKAKDQESTNWFQGRAAAGVSWGLENVPPELKTVKCRNHTRARK